MKQIRKTLLVAALGALAASALAGTRIDKLTVTPAGGVHVGQKLVATIDFTPETLCGMEVEFGDGTRKVFKIKPDAVSPIVVEYSYAAAGKYKIRAAGDRVENALGCEGKQIIEQYAVTAAAAQSAAVSPAVSRCPADWVQQGKVAKSGAFACMPRKGVKNPARPEKALDCPAGTRYFAKGKRLGCEKN